MKLTPVALAVACCSAAVVTTTFAQSPVKPAQFPEGRPYSPYANRGFPTQVYWGDEHLHTAWSGDAAASGTTLGPEEALRFARGEQVTSNSGQPVKLGRALDWLSITDHSDALGVVSGIISGDPELLKDPKIKEWHEKMQQGGAAATAVMSEMISMQSNGTLPKAMTDPEFLQTVWERHTAIVDRYNDPGKFTAFIAYEWSSNPGGGDNLHRNVIYRDDKSRADQATPMTTFDSNNPEKLWEWMAAYEEKTGGRMLAIPHNGNLSNGRMFSLKTFEGKELTKAWADARAKWEPLYEITQPKGTGEQHPTLSPNDEFAGFEIWDKGNLNLLPKKEGMIATEYAREALKNGLMLEEKLGTNPFKFGIAGGTDMHTGLTADEENNFFGKYGTSEPKGERWNDDALSFEGRVVKDWEMGASGRTGVWATENTREALWDAMARKETYGTTGPLITVRFFGGFDFTADDALSREPANIGYAKGVPMGGDLQRAPEGKAPSFLVGARKDPMYGNLDRIQIIKGWVDDKGDTHEKIYDVVWGDADSRSIGDDGKLAPVGNTVDAANATWTNTIGDPELITVWTDPDFDPSLRAFYYARVLEIPTPRWTTYDAARFGITVGPEVPVSIQERAYTSPIWYTP
ncbi:hypothetical protein GCM10011348_13320 [Marinobacterium nitratireducens]|uniref:DUF3604 domain-containing protein n=1 Tax=Marinobacterium nitratireducens TaxID=518897 RepID=A0A918DPZ9_9GAMM|nr:DUF3604 domain-containing protein [Marinobacterium nitratireducens]GGO79324.1 hypothetical protein GCM10011348_13320 [Marinobacterium nitratireducens]